MAKKKYAVSVSLGGKVERYVTEADSPKPMDLGNGLMQIGEVTFREGGLLSIAPADSKED